MKNTIIITVIILAASMRTKAQTIDSTFSASHKMNSSQIIPIRDNSFAPDTAKYISIVNYATDAWTYFTFNWVAFDSTGKPLRNKTETLNGISFLTLTQAIKASNNLIPILTWIGTTYSLTFK